ncbi:MAG: hypothetical protein EPO64_02315 [Nitrospirae bacterium]|nr:MAG: hypothetical protein EPO64_02315 [Nitrospirota bacterium]
MRWTQTLAAVIAIPASLLWLTGCAVPALPDLGEVHIDRWATIKAADKDVGEILAAFNRAEESLHEENLDGIMALYSEQYKYHGLTKADLRKTWQELFAHYDHIASTHIFSRIRATASGKNPTAEIVCTGSLWGVSTDTGQRTIIDSWFYETHNMIYEDGAWRIRGHGAEEAPKVLPFGVAPHPFF